jgi:predicted nucleic acid-binding protein
MNDKFFIDTNVLVYCFDDREPEKKKRALALVSEALQSSKGMISGQVVQEFLNVTTRKFAIPFTLDDARFYLQKVLNPLCQYMPDFDLFQKALDVSEKTGYSFYDSLILASAIAGECGILYSEDFHDGQNFGGIKIVNPFK